MILSMFHMNKASPAAPLYAAVVAGARQPDWFREAGVEDTMDGRYCVLATLLALTDLRLAQGNEGAQALAPRLTELFIDDMDAQLCQSGLGDPTLGKTVRGMVAGVSARIDRLQKVVGEGGSGDWLPVLSFALYRSRQPSGEERRAARALIDQWLARLAQASDAELGKGLPQ